MTRAFVVTVAVLSLFALLDRSVLLRAVPAPVVCPAPIVCPPPPVCPAPVVASAIPGPDVLPRAVRIERSQLHAPTVIDFERDLKGRPLEAGRVLDELYAPLGVRLRSSVEGSPIVADEYVVASESRHLSAATQTPRWTGETTISFDRPVRAAGFYVAHVFIGGTGVEAYDAAGELLGRIYADEPDNDFLGLRSTGAPIARLRIFPVPHIDPNFTIDDLAFER